jgi:hypothetical protein
VNEDIIIPIAGMIMITTLALGIPIVRSYLRRKEMEAIRPAGDPLVADRLERIEHAIDAMSVEVERISEGQRFVTRLLSERPAERVAIPSSGGSSHA